MQPIAGQNLAHLILKRFYRPVPRLCVLLRPCLFAARIEVLQRLPCARPPRRLSAPGLNDLLHARVDARRIPVKPVRLPAERILRRQPRPLRGRPAEQQIGRERVVPARPRVVGRAVVVGKAQPRADRVVRLMQPIPLRLVVRHVPARHIELQVFLVLLPLRPARGVRARPAVHIRAPSGRAAREVVLPRRAADPVQRAAGAAHASRAEKRQVLQPLQAEAALLLARRRRGSRVRALCRAAGRTGRLAVRPAGRYKICSGRLSGRVSGRTSGAAAESARTARRTLLLQRGIDLSLYPFKPLCRIFAQC